MSSDTPSRPVVASDTQTQSRPALTIAIIVVFAILEIYLLAAGQNGWN